MAAQPDPDLPTSAVVIVVTRSGGVAGIRRGWAVETADPNGWQPLVDACPWQDEPERAGADRFVWRIEVRAPEPPREVELPENAVHGPWRELVDRVREEGRPIAAARPGRPPTRQATDATGGDG